MGPEAERRVAGTDIAHSWLDRQARIIEEIGDFDVEAPRPPVLRPQPERHRSELASFATSVHGVQRTSPCKALPRLGSFNGS